MNPKLDELLLHKPSVILIEGTRNVPESDESAIRAFAAELAKRCPGAVFRTGNASGSDELFAQGVISRDPARLQYVLPYAGHRRRHLHPAACSLALSEIAPEAENAIALETEAATPANARIIALRNEVPQLKSKARYLMRDTLKVVGDKAHELKPATLGIFYVNASNPEGGGTGHTMRVCRRHNVPVFTQTDWM
jgi:hypothetical protein